MSAELAKQAREAMRAKTARLVAPTTGRIDASSYGPEEDMNAGVQTGERPISRRQYQAGGMVSGAAAPVNAGRSARKSGGAALTPTSLINRDVREANESREGYKHIGGFKRGGKCDGGAMASGGMIDEGTRPQGGRMPRKSGGATGKGKMNVNIVIATGPKDQPQGPAPMAAAPPPMPAMPPHPAPPPPMAGAGAALPPMPQGAPPPPVMRKSGGRTGSYYDKEAGAGSGLGRLEKTEREKRVYP